MNLFMEGFIPPGWSKGDGVFIVNPKPWRDGVAVRIARWSEDKSIGINPVMSIGIRAEYAEEFEAWYRWWQT